VVLEPALPEPIKYVDFTLVHMIAYITTSIAIGPSQGKLPLFLREEIRRFWSIWQKKYGDET
jgi:hypothetical protein